MILYDCTLRDGMQGEGMSLSAEEKLRVAHVLDGLGIDIIEAGFPASNPKEEAFFALLAQETFQHAQIAAFGMTRRRDVAAEDDPALRLLADTFAPVTTIVGKSWGLHLEKVVKVSRAENLAMIADSVAFLVRAGKRVIYDAEHFFDGYADDPAYALECVRAAAAAGAEWVTLCDTNGGTMPHDLAAATREVIGALGPIVGIHCHDDAGCGVANSIAAVREGAGLVQGTMNGYGERCGNANLVTIVPNLQLKLGIECVPTLSGFTEASHFLDELLNFTPEPNRPYVGHNAFAHKGGLHVAGVNADPATFEHIDPQQVGNTREILISELSGKGTVLARAGVDLDDAAANRLIERVKALEHAGYHFEAADGSFDVLVAKEMGEYEPLFRLDEWHVSTRSDEKRGVRTEAVVRLRIGDELVVRHAEGNGPVQALDRALRRALEKLHPEIRDMHLTDFKVRILDGEKATGATTRVLLDATDGHSTWGAIGVHENIIEASWEALVSSLEAGMLARRKAARVNVADGLARPGRGGAGGGQGGARQRAALARPEGPRVRGGLRGDRGGEVRLRGVVRDGRPAPRAARRRRHGRRRGRHLPVQLRRLVQRDPLRARHAGVRGHRPGHAVRARRRRRGGGDRAHGRRPAGLHLRPRLRDPGASTSR